MVIGADRQQEQPADKVPGVEVDEAVARPQAQASAAKAQAAWRRGWEDRMRFAQQACGGE